jgi:hypothetical protein
MTLMTLSTSGVTVGGVEKWLCVHVIESMVEYVACSHVLFGYRWNTKQSDIQKQRANGTEFQPQNRISVRVSRARDEYDEPG